MNIDPKTLNYAITIGAFHLEAGARSFADFSAKMVEEFGEGVRKYLQPAYEALRKRTDIDTTGMDELSPASQTTTTPIMKAQTDNAFIGTQIPWKTVQNVHLRIKSVTPLAKVTASGKLVAPKVGIPYALLKVENGTHPDLFVLPVTHRLDFLNLWAIYEKRGIQNDEEVLVAYTPQQGILSKTQPSLSFLIYPAGYLENIVDPKQPEAANRTPLGMAYGLRSNIRPRDNKVEKEALAISVPISPELSPLENRHFSFTWVDFAVGGLAWGIVDSLGLIATVIRETNAYGDDRLMIGAAIGGGSVALGMYGSRAIRRAVKAPSLKFEPIQSDKGKAFAEAKNPLSSSSPLSVDMLGYDLLTKELECGKRDEVLWLKSFSDSDGDEAKAQAAYNRVRASTLAKEFSTKQKAVEQSRREKVEAAELAERMEREARENERKAKADAAEAEEKRFINEVNASLFFFSQSDSTYPSLVRLENSRSQLDKLLPQLLVKGMNELAGKVRDCQARISELLVTHAEHRAALEGALPLVAANKIAPIREMMNHALKGRFEDLDYTPFQDLIDKARQRYELRFAIVFVMILAIPIGFGIYNSMVEAKRSVVPDEKSVVSAPANDLASDRMEKEADVSSPHLSTTPANQPPLDPFSATARPTFHPPMALPNREPEAVRQLETPAPSPAAPPSPAPIDPSDRQIVSVDLSSTVRIVKIKRGDSLSVRGGPGTSFQKIGEIPAQATGIRLLGNGQGKPAWFPVVWKDVQGWVNGSFLDYE